MDLCTLTWLIKAPSTLWLNHPHPPLGMTPLNRVTLEDLAPGVEVMMVETTEMLTWATGASEAALEEALEAATMAAKVGTRDSAWTKKGEDSSWNSFDLLEERGEEKKKNVLCKLIFISW
ncbi:unnamed protein product [Cuscuta epithymum]|uniref:Uncharacterized protein n=1 Tax=Cuscuta epithymum TaxID=186058 RepID=A0AAV0C998_9ASTE|nr:unnamed protein product [Cuscuta epithymum]